MANIFAAPKNRPLNDVIIISGQVEGEGGEMRGEEGERRVEEEGKGKSLVGAGRDFWTN